MARSDAREWWRHALIYQIYPRSFADATGDGVGDLAGVRSRLGYLRDLGVDAIRFTPWYVSPLADVDSAPSSFLPGSGSLAGAAKMLMATKSLNDASAHTFRPFI